MKTIIDFKNKTIIGICKAKEFKEQINSLRFHHPETQKDSDSIRPPYNPSGLFNYPQRDAKKNPRFFQAYRRWL